MSHMKRKENMDSYDLSLLDWNNLFVQFPLVNHYRSPGRSMVQQKVPKQIMPIWLQRVSHYKYNRYLIFFLK